jgi:hypothetical protein
MLDECTHCHAQVCDVKIATQCNVQSLQLCSVISDHNTLLEAHEAPSNAFSCSNQRHSGLENYKFSRPATLPAQRNCAPTHNEKPSNQRPRRRRGPSGPNKPHGRSGNTSLQSEWKCDITVCTCAMSKNHVKRD